MKAVIRIRFRGSNLLIEPNNDQAMEALPQAIKDFAWFNEEYGRYQCLPMFFPKIVKELSSCQANIQINWEINRDFKLEKTLDTQFTLRPYQQEALNSWLENNNRGVIVLPTGAGKTFVGLSALVKKNVRTLIVVPTINLLDQWRERLLEFLTLTPQKIGLFGGGKQELEDITITTYDSGYLYSHRFRDQFGLLICDEVHHLPTENYRKIAEQLIAPFRLGLTATLKRPDLKHREVEDELIGSIVFQMAPEEVQAMGYVADFDLEKIFVDLTPGEQEAYKKQWGIYSDYLRKTGITFSSGMDFQKKLIKRMGWDHRARKAVRAHHKARMIALTASEKINALDQLLEKHKDESVIIFSEFAEMVELVSRTFLIPAITHKTPNKQRKTILKRFETGTITKLVTGRVLDEGFDVKRPSVGIIASGSGVERQFIQRLGRILRPAKGKKAILYELIAKETLEVRSSKRRRPTTRKSK
ncbi:MAG: DEAD/DEAH box helicase [Candidatus Heimdallarchaeota archaeon]|nr:DEAD/DEAH box helicase [Candidatus Heimdallarchaeota archaeon]